MGDYLGLDRGEDSPVECDSGGSVSPGDLEGMRPTSERYPDSGVRDGVVGYAACYFFKENSPGILQDPIFKK
jgi:hypothetical protein